MKISRFTDSNILAILKQAEAVTPVAGFCHEHGMSNASFIDGAHALAWMDTFIISHHKELED